MQSEILAASGDCKAGCLDDIVIRDSQRTQETDASRHHPCPGTKESDTSQRKGDLSQETRSPADRGNNTVRDEERVFAMHVTGRVEGKMMNSYKLIRKIKTSR